jgi:hypothetical protein
MAMWMSIEVFDGEFYPAASWTEAFGDSVVEAALSGGATDWNWHPTSWGVVFEVAFEDEDAWDRFRASLAVRVALESVPNPVNGVLVYKGRGGSAGTTKGRKPRPLIGSGSAALPLPIEQEFFDFSLGIEPLRLLSVTG